jgi:hypothetical protein
MTYVITHAAPDDPAVLLLCCVQAAEAQRQQHVEEAAQSAAKRARKSAAASQSQPAQELEQPAPAGVQHDSDAAAAAAELAGMAPGGEDRLPDEVVAELLRRQRYNPVRYLMCLQCHHIGIHHRQTQTSCYSIAGATASRACTQRDLALLHCAETPPWQGRPLRSLQQTVVNRQRRAGGGRLCNEMCSVNVKSGT